MGLEGKRIVALGKANQMPPASPTDLGDVAILPGLVNAHTHLEFSDLTKPIGQAGIKLHDWIGEVVRHRQRPHAEAVATSIQRGIEASRDSGVSLVVDIATTPMPTLNLPAMVAPEVTFMAEVLGLTPERSQNKLACAIQHIEQQSSVGSYRAGISPHAPYSTPLTLVEQCVTLSKRHNLPLAMHIAESLEERQLIEQGDGPFADRLNAIQVFDSSIFPWGKDAMVALIRLLADAPRSLLVHGNDLRPREIELVARHPQMTVVYCPRTHAFFGHAKHPVAELLGAGIRVALGTDSLASNPDLSLWREVQWLLLNRQDLSWQSLLSMATINGADAIGRSDHGRIAPGALAYLLTLPTKAVSEDQIAESMVQSQPSWLESPGPTVEIK